MDESNEPGSTCQDCGFINPQSEEYCVACNAKIGSVRIGMKVDQEAGSGQYKQLKDKVGRPGGGLPHPRPVRLLVGRDFETVHPQAREPRRSVRRHELLP